MELIDQRTKKIMEECKERAKAIGLDVKRETLEYIITNQEMLELGPKVMIPTLYDYWVEDVEVVRDKWLYRVFPRNPYETVINTRPPISFYNDNNSDWANVAIFDHVLGHIWLFQNNVFFQSTWHRDFCGEALADKRLINRIREEMGAEKRWVDYVIEFARGIDNLVGYYRELREEDRIQTGSILGVFSEKIDFYFGEFLRQHFDEKMVTTKFYHEELERLNVCQRQFGQKHGDPASHGPLSRNGEAAFFDDPVFKSKFPEFNGVFRKCEEKKKKPKTKDILQYLVEYSEFMNKEENKWMKDVLDVVRRTSLYFQPQIRTKMLHESFSSIIHERLFIADPRISSHEVEFARFNSGVVFDPRIGLNPYISCKHILEYIEDLAAKGKLSYEYQLMKDLELRKRFDRKPGEGIGREALFEAVRNFDDFMLINFLSDDDFQDLVNKHNLFVAGRRLSQDEPVVEIYVKSRSGKEYRKMLNDSLYHPPHVLINEEKSEEGELYLDHVFEGRTLVTRYIPAVLKGLSYLWGNLVSLETTEFEMDKDEDELRLIDPEYKPKYRKVRILYTCDGQDIERAVISGKEAQHG